MNLTQYLCAIGIFLSVYAFYVERRIKRNPKYIPVCDISKKISCSKVVASPYGHLFFISNSLLGVLYYALVFILMTIGKLHWAFIAAVWGVIFSFVLGYYQYYKVKSFCLVCTATYLVNALILLSLVWLTWM
jgi:vitamin-K-epoxide reductase (warfarin-sensitive)